MKTKILPIILLFCLLFSACSLSTKKTGTVETLIRDSSSNEMFAHIKLDDGTKVVALPNVVTQLAEGGFRSQLVDKGQRVEIEPLEEANGKKSMAKWKITRILETSKQ